MKDLKYMVGTMIEIPRAALTADEVAKEAEFFSFGTNDLTQTTLGPLAATTIGKFSQDYEDKKIFKARPVRRPGPGRRGQAGGDGGEAGPRRPARTWKSASAASTAASPSSVEFCYRVGMNYVSCSPYRVPIARLAAAQAALAGDKSETMRTA